MPRNSAEVSINSCQVGGLTHPTEEAMCLKGEAKLLNFAGARGKASQASFWAQLVKGH